MNKFLTLCLTILGPMLLAGTSSSAAETSWITPDFFITTTQHSGKSAPPSDCRAHIEDIMCMVDPTPPGTDMGNPRLCLPGGQGYAHFFQEIYDHYPPAFQKIFCSLKVIYVERVFYGTAYAGVVHDQNGGLDG